MRHRLGRRPHLQLVQQLAHALAVVHDLLPQLRVAHRSELCSERLLLLRRRCRRPCSGSARRRGRRGALLVVALCRGARALLHDGRDVCGLRLRLLRQLAGSRADVGQEALHLWGCHTPPLALLAGGSHPARLSAHGYGGPVC